MDYMQALSHSIITKLQVLNPMILVGVATLLFWSIQSYHGFWRLRQFPTVGSSLPVLSLIGMINFMRNTQNMVTTGRQKWPGRIFKVLSPNGWYVVITDPTHIDEMKKAPEHILSARKVAGEMLQARFTLYRQESGNQLTHPIIKKQLSKELSVLVADVYSEVVEVCNQYFPANDEWTSVVVPETMLTITARAANRIFVGPILCRNSDWMKLCTKFTRDVVKTALLLSLFPSFLRPLVNYAVGGKVVRRNRDGLALLKPFIAARRDEKVGSTEKFNDFLAWLMAGSEGKDREDWPIAARIFSLNFAALHTTTMAISHALLDLVSNPEYLKPLREEVEEVTKREGWTKAALDQMCKIDSFLKESQRIHPAGVLMMGRYTVNDYTFSDGTFVPAGTIMAVSSKRVHLDPQTYEDPLKFDGFRFIKKKELAALDGYPHKVFDMVTTSADFVAFGQGRHACPGRYFAAAEIKLLLAYIVATYDVKLDDTRPGDLYQMNGIRPDPAARVYFRRRQ